MKTFKRTFEKRTLPIVEALKREQLRHYDAIIIDKIGRDAITLRRIYECQCNGCTRDKLPNESWSDYDKARELQMTWVDKREEVLTARIKKNAESVGLQVYFQGDPRGASVYLSNRPIKGDSYSTSSVVVC